DLVSRRELTPFLLEAKRLGLRIRNGDGMLCAQAEAQQRAWGLRSDMPSQLEMRLSIVGYRGVGKSSIGRALAERLGLAFVDLDHVIEERSAMPIREFFDKFGEAAFRDIEADTLEKALAVRGSYVLACGGGVVERRSNCVALAGATYTLLLDANEATILQRLEGDNSRPMLHAEGQRAELQARLPLRMPVYAAIADVRVDVSDGSIDDNVTRCFDAIADNCLALGVRR
ncbi:MAG: hypothetical protein KDB07_04990, partial [Planctomycetes bacterium]|nr:hypothetical protein [Planctomycetota bacterium]